MNNLLTFKRSFSYTLTIVLALVVLLSATAPAMAWEGSPTPPSGMAAVRSLPAAAGPTDPAELGAFLDDVLGKEMAEYHIAGAAVSVVKDGKLFFAKGYGYADLEKQIPVDPEQTVFRLGSVSKLFTWTAVMQLAEQGKLDLDADINTYLDFRIPDTYPQPITLKHLMSHTSGFEDRVSDMMTMDAAGLQPVRAWLIAHMHARVRAPGEAAAYSNYNTMLAGYIVERVSGQPYDEYVQQHILDALGMTHTTARSVMPPALHAQLSVGYDYKDGAFEPGPDYLGQPAMVPAGGMYASATDMARFMIAHLQDGAYSDDHISGVRILEAATAQQMHGTLYTPDPRLLGNAYGFFEFSDNGERVIGHSGEAPPMHTLLLLLPERGVGVYVAYNSDGGSKVTNQHLGFQRAFFDHYYPTPAVEPIQPPADFASRAGRFAGTYAMTRGSQTTMEKAGGLFTPTMEIKDPGDGTLLFVTPWGDWRFVEVAPLYFRQVDGQFDLFFREDGRGRISYMFTGVTPMYAYEKLRWYEMPGFHMELLLACALIFLSMLIVALIGFVRGRLNAGRKPASSQLRVAQGIGVAISLLNLLFVFGTMQWGNPAPLFGVSLIYKMVLGLGVASAVLTAGALVCTVLAWKNRTGSLVARVYYSVVTVAALAFVWFLNYWNLLGWRY